MPPVVPSSASDQSARKQAFWLARKDEITNVLLRSLRHTLFSSRAFVRPAILPEIAASQCANFLDFVVHGDAGRVIGHGEELCGQGLSLEALQHMGSSLRTYCEAQGVQAETAAYWPELEHYLIYLVQGFVSAHEQLVLQEQEHIRSALQRSLSAYSLQMEAASEVARVATSILDLDTLLTTTVLLIHERFLLQFVGVYLVGPDNAALSLQASIGEIDVKLPVLPQVRVGDETVVSQAVQYRQPQTPTIVLDGEQATQALSALALPMIVRDHVIGALLLQSRRHGSFSSQDISAFRLIADQLATAVENARLYAGARQQAAELAEANARLQALDRMKTRFIQNVSHELRTPLSVIIGYNDLLLSGQLGTPSPAQQEVLSIIARSANDLHELVLDTMSIIEVESRQATPVDVDIVTIASEVITDFLPQINEKALDLQVDLAVTQVVPPVRIAAAHLRRVVSNLLGNALKFTATGGTISVLVRQQGDTVQLQVSDTGIGLTPEQCEHVFERFYQANSTLGNPARGTGLGLALVKEIVDVYGGRVEVASEGLGKGSTFTVWLPLAHS